MKSCSYLRVKYKDAHSRFARLSPVGLDCLSVKFGSIVQHYVSNYKKLLVFDSSNIKSFHPYIHCKKVERPTVGPLWSNDEWPVAPLDMASYFVDVFTSTLLPNTFPWNHCYSKFSFIVDSFDIFTIQESRSKHQSSSSCPFR